MNPMKRYPPCPARCSILECSNLATRRNSRLPLQKLDGMQILTHTHIHLVPRSGEGRKKKKKTWLHRSSGNLLDELKLLFFLSKG